MIAPLHLVLMWRYKCIEVFNVTDINDILHSMKFLASKHSQLSSIRKTLY